MADLAWYVHLVLGCCCFLSSYLLRVMVMVDEGRVMVDEGRVMVDEGRVIADEGRVMGG